MAMGAETVLSVSMVHLYVELSAKYISAVSLIILDTCELDLDGHLIGCFEGVWK